MEHLTCDALRVDADKGRGGGDLSHDQCNGFFDGAITVMAGLSAEAVDGELSPAGGKLRGGYLPYSAGHIIIIGLAGSVRANCLDPSARVRQVPLVRAWDPGPLIAVKRDESRLSAG